MQRSADDAGQSNACQYEQHPEGGLAESRREQVDRAQRQHADQDDGAQVVVGPVEERVPAAGGADHLGEGGDGVKPQRDAPDEQIRARLRPVLESERQGKCGADQRRRQWIEDHEALSLFQRRFAESAQSLTRPSSPRPYSRARVLGTGASGH